MKLLPKKKMNILYYNCWNVHLAKTRYKIILKSLLLSWLIDNFFPDARMIFIHDFHVIF